MFMYILMYTCTSACVVTILYYQMVYVMYVVYVRIVCYVCSICTVCIVYTVCIVCTVCSVYTVCIVCSVYSVYGHIHTEMLCNHMTLHQNSHSLSIQMVALHKHCTNVTCTYVWIGLYAICAVYTVCTIICSVCTVCTYICSVHTICTLCVMIVY